MEDDEFASMCVCAILTKFEAITTCAADFESAVNRWDEQQDDQRLDVVPARPSPGLVPLLLARPNPALTLTLNQVLLDWELGSMSGLDVLKHIQRRKEAALSTKSNPLLRAALTHGAACRCCSCPLRCA